MRIYWIDFFQKGSLGMMARPRGNDWLEDEIKKLHMLGVHLVISLLEDHEEVELQLTEEQTLCENYGIRFINFPISDRGVPEDVESFLQLITKIDQSLKEDKKIVVHCRMGIGRTSVVAAAVLIKNGHTPESVFEYLSEMRTLAVPDTEEQINWVIDQQNILLQVL